MRSDAQRNQQILLQAAIDVFDTSGVDAPVREIAKKAGMGIGTLYHHLPRRADLIIAVFRNDVDQCASFPDTSVNTQEPLPIYCNGLTNMSRLLSVNGAWLPRSIPGTRLITNGPAICDNGSAPC